MKKRGHLRSNKCAQTSIEYLIIVSFITLIIIGILGVAFFYSNSIRDRIKILQMENFANKIISTAESVSYSGDPSKATIDVYLPEGVESISIHEGENLLIISLQTNSGTTTNAYSSNVEISGSITPSFGLKKIQIEAQANNVVITQI